MARKIDIVDGRAALGAVRDAEAAGTKPARAELATAVRYLLQLLDEKALATASRCGSRRSEPCR